MQLSMAGIHPDFAHEKKPSRRAVGVSRKDTIIIAMLVNIALLAVLFATASRQTQVVLPSRVEPVVAQFETLSQVTKPNATVEVQIKEPVDEIDEILKSYALQNSAVAQTEAKVVTELPKKAVVAPVAISSVPTIAYSEVKVKQGDVLSRIAQQNRVKVEDIIVLNGLESTNLKIGQVLKIPTTKTTTSSKAAVNEPVAEFYVVKNGDSPWKIAKKCRIGVEDLLRLNNLDEEKARNLKIGQKLRIR